MTILGKTQLKSPTRRSKRSASGNDIDRIETKEHLSFTDSSSSWNERIVVQVKQRGEQDISVSQHANFYMHGLIKHLKKCGAQYSVRLLDG